MLFQVSQTWLSFCLQMTCPVKYHLLCIESKYLFFTEKKPLCLVLSGNWFCPECLPNGIISHSQRSLWVHVGKWQNTFEAASPARRTHFFLSSIFKHKYQQVPSFLFPLSPSFPTTTESCLPLALQHHKLPSPPQRPSPRKQLRCPRASQTRAGQWLLWAVQRVEHRGVMADP